MGGYNSSRWHHHIRKMTVEECQRLQVNDYPKSLLEERCEAGAPVYFGESYPVIYNRLRYRLALENIVPLRDEELAQPVGQAFHVARTACNYGGWRYWLVCPGCQRRYGVLYNQSDPDWYACRKCHDLTYASSQDAQADRSRRAGDVSRSLQAD